MLMLSLCTAAGLYAQDFTKQMASAQTAYASGKLEDARFSMQQMMQELDMTIGKEVLKLLPAKLDVMSSKEASDEVTGTSGFIGVLIHRDYAAADKSASIDIISNSPMVASINMIMAIPFIGRSADGKQKMVKVQGYKGLLQKNEDSTTKAVSYDLQLPFGATLLTLKTENSDEDQVLKMAELLPIAQIAKMVQ